MPLLLKLNLLPDNPKEITVKQTISLAKLRYSLQVATSYCISKS